ncbi:hypothetical protein PF011_g24031 [Phytophthora fragariae]|uniref:Uncharacterized protein n=1 Tax=Phytophthora fragariae TaxID=53985 RepID=A0A6A3I0Y1_9STRA|nr:hypothetical protein PF011_g24031 [Phytophthora fragariae]
MRVLPLASKQSFVASADASGSVHQAGVIVSPPSFDDPCPAPRIVMATPPFGSIALSGHSGVLMRRNLVAEPTEAATGSALALGPAHIAIRRLQGTSPSTPTQHQVHSLSAMPKSAHSVEGASAVEDHAAMKKQWQTNLEIDLLKSAWIRKDREQHGAHTTPPLSAAK